MRAAGFFLVFGLWPALVLAQSPDGRLEVSGGLRVTGAEVFPAVASTQTRAGGGTRQVFQTRTEIEAFPAVEARLGLGLTRVFQLEGAAVVGRSNVTTAVTGDVEGVANLSASAPITHYGFEGSVVTRLARWRRGRLTPLILAGATYFRQVQDGGVLVDTGRSYHVGAGGDYRWRSAPQAGIRSAGLRADVRLLVQQGGLDDTLTRTLPAFSASVYMRF